jgi:PAS domain S-box-containing protein
MLANLRWSGSPRRSIVRTLLVPLIAFAVGRLSRRLRVAPLRDLTERKRVEDELRLYQLMVEHAEDYAIFRLDSEGRVASWNIGAERIKGYRPEEIIGQHISCLYPPEDIVRGKPAHLLQLAASEGRIEDEGWRVRKDGSRFWADVVITALRDEHGHLIGFSKITRDLTERKQAEEERECLLQQLQVERGRLEAVLQQMPAGVIIAEAPSGRLLLGNAQVAQIWRHTFLIAEEIDQYRQYQGFHPDGRPYAPAEWPLAHSILTGEVVTMEEINILRGDGTFGTIQASSAPIRDQVGTIIAGVVIFDDITARKQAESEIRELTATLEQRVQERTRQLTEVNEALEAFSHSISHDLREPLRGLEGMAQALLEDYGAQLDSVGQDYARRIVMSAQSMERLIQDLLAYSRLSHTELMLQPVNLKMVVGEALEQIEPELRERHAQVTVAETLPEVLAHSTVLVQVLVNLLTNAVKFVAPETQPEVQVWAEQRANYVRLWIVDNGIGIAPDDCARIFNVFERLHGVETYPGTGIGLAIVQKSMERMGGQVGVESQLGQGSRFWIDLLAVEQQDEHRATV